jgi:hypothetical protein
MTKGKTKKGCRHCGQRHGEFYTWCDQGLASFLDALTAHMDKWRAKQPKRIGDTP